jgi:hypothetical protein
VGGGEEPILSANSRELFYRIGERVMAVEITRQSSLKASAPRELFTGPYRRGAAGRGRNITSARTGVFCC